jgi:hypothetical protein
MPLKAPATNKDFEIVPVGNHAARLYRIIHLGVIPGEYMGEAKETDTILLGFELPNETKVFKEGEEPKPFVISQEYTLSMSAKSNLRKLVESILGTTFEDDDAASDFDIYSLIGSPCLLNVVHKTSQAGREYAKIMNGTPLPKGMEIPAPINEPFILDFEDNWSQEKFDKQPEYLRKKITSSKNYQTLTGKKPYDPFQPDDENINPADIPF